MTDTGAGTPLRERIEGLRPWPEGEHLIEALLRLHETTYGRAEAGTPPIESIAAEMHNECPTCHGGRDCDEVIHGSIVMVSAALRAARPATDRAGLDAALREYFRAVDDIRDAGEARMGDPTLIARMYRDAGERKGKAEAILRARLSVADGPGPEERLRAAAEVWLLNYSEVEEYADGERGCTQLDHGHEEYEQRMDLIVALRAAVEETGRS